MQQMSVVCAAVSCGGDGCIVLFGVDVRLSGVVLLIQQVGR